MPMQFSLTFSEPPSPQHTQTVYCTSSISTFATFTITTTRVYHPCYPIKFHLLDRRVIIIVLREFLCLTVTFGKGLYTAHRHVKEEMDRFESCCCYRCCCCYCCCCCCVGGYWSSCYCCWRPDDFHNHSAVELVAWFRLGTYTMRDHIFYGSQE